MGTVLLAPAEQHTFVGQDQSPPEGAFGIIAYVFLTGTCASEADRSPGRILARRLAGGEENRKRTDD